MDCPGNLPGDDETHVNHMGKMFVMSRKTKRKNFSGASQDCDDQGGTLAVVGTVEQSLISSIVPSEGAWIGASKTGTNGWAWMNGSDLIERDTFWARKGRHEGNCALIDDRGTKNNIRKADCSLIRPFICELHLPYNVRTCFKGIRVWQNACCYMVLNKAGVLAGNVAGSIEEHNKQVFGGNQMQTREGTQRH